MKTSRLITTFFVGFLFCANVSLAQRKKTQKSSTTATVPNAQTEWKTAASSETYLIEFSPKRLTRISPTIIRVWTRRHSLQENSDTGFTMLLSEYNCRTRASRSVKTVMYDAAGKMLITSLTSELYSTPNAEWEFVIPNTLGEDELETICKFRR
jgi:hypothetical protein